MNAYFDFDFLTAQVKALTQGVPHLIANLSNISALLWQALEDINWVGFYKMEGGQLVLYPFQGKPACIEIPLGKGVCGTAAAQGKTQLVPNVHDFPGHIACDSASNAEIVVPLWKNGEVWGVLDIDSPTVGRFAKEDQDGLEQVAKAIEEVLQNNGITY